MVCYSNLVFHCIPAQEILKLPVSKISSFIVDDCFGRPKVGENILVKEFYHYLGIVHLECHSFHLLGDIVDHYQNIMVPIRWWEWPHEINAPNIKWFDL